MNMWVSVAKLSLKLKYRFELNLYEITSTAAKSLPQQTQKGLSFRQFYKYCAKFCESITTQPPSSTWMCLLSESNYQMYSFN